MSYRSYEINTNFSHSIRKCRISTSCRAEAARVWNDLIIRHHRIRRLNFKWPNYYRWCEWAKGRYQKLGSQTVQQICSEFVEALKSIKALKANGHLEARYPIRQVKYRDIPYTNQSAKIRNTGFLILPNGKSGKLAIRLPEKFTPIGKFAEARLCYGKIILVYKQEDKLHNKSITNIGVDLGVNTLICATDGERSISVSGRELKATVQWRSKNLAAIQELQSKKTKYSRAWKRLQRRKRKLLNKSNNRVKDFVHKATRKVANFFPDHHAFIGKAFNGAARKAHRTQAQQVASCSTGKILSQLSYKLSGSATSVAEHFSSQTCPVCGCRHKCRRIYQCTCGFTAPRDLVGAINIKCIGEKGKLEINPSLASKKIKSIFKYPEKLLSGSSGGSPASSSTYLVEKPFNAA